jgi:hypothetical protein
MRPQFRRRVVGESRLVQSFERSIMKRIRVSRLSCVSVMFVSAASALRFNAFELVMLSQGLLAKTPVEKTCDKCLE